MPILFPLSNSKITGGDPMPKLHIVGAGTPTPTRDRWGTCFILEICGQRLMIDCGPASTFKMHRLGISCTSVHNLFFTHLHSDHHLRLSLLPDDALRPVHRHRARPARLWASPDQADHRRHLESRWPLLVRRDRPHQSSHERPRLPDARRRGRFQTGTGSPHNRIHRGKSGRRRRLDLPCA